MSLIDDLKLKYKMSSVVEKLIVINILVFVIFHVLETVGFLFNYKLDLVSWFSFPKEFDSYLTKPWSIVTYAFLHAGIMHIVSNMIILYFAGRYFVSYISGKKALTVYFLGAIFGALLYMVSYNFFPAFSNTGNVPLVGASASVMAILIAITAYIPNMTVRLMFLGNIKFWWIAAFFVIMDVMQIRGDNAGGHLAHLGGAIFGYLYTAQLKRGNDIGAWFERIGDAFTQMFAPKKKSPLKTVHKSKTYASTVRKTKSTVSETKKQSKSQNQAQIDAILDKISKSGYDSLTKEEKDFLFKAGKE